MKETDSLIEQASLLRAMAHPLRLRILGVLGQGECCVCHLVSVLKRRQPYISQHLMVLREGGLVLDRKEGVMVYYRLADERVLNLLAVTQELLRAQGVPVNPLPVPKSPVAGCPCPRCSS